MNVGIYMTTNVGIPMTTNVQFFPMARAVAARPTAVCLPAPFPTPGPKEGGVECSAEVFSLWDSFARC